MGLCQDFYNKEAWREAGYTSLEDFLNRFWNAYFAPMDPNNLIWMGWKWRHGDVSLHTGGDLKAALGRIKAKTYVVPFSRDMFSTGRLRGRAETDPEQQVPGHR